MEVTLKASACRTISVVILAAALGLSPAAYGGQEAKNQALPGAMPVAEQNVLVQKYCAGCHDDAHRNGGLSLQHFDASQVEPSLAAMMVSKLKSGAMGAAGLGLPDTSTQDGFLNALTAKSAGASEWILTRTQDPATQAPILTASIVRELPSTANPQNAELYRLKLTCRTDTREAEMQLTWAPQPANSARTMSVAADGREPITYTVEGRERMGNGAKLGDGTDVTTGPAAANLSVTPLPARALIISQLFPDEMVVFPFDRLTQTMRQELSTCFTRSAVSR